MCKKGPTPWEKQGEARGKKVKLLCDCHITGLRGLSKIINMSIYHNITLEFLKSNRGWNICWIELNSRKAHSTSTEVADINVWFCYLNKKDTLKY